LSLLKSPAMIALPGYQILTQIYESANSLVYRGLRNQDNKAVILKVLNQDYPTPEKITRYKQEYEITRNLNLDGVVKAYTLEKYQRTLIIIFEDFGGSSLNILIDYRKFTLTEFLDISIKITESLSQIHAANIIHKDINPSNIVVNKTGQVKLIDFGISTVMSQETLTIKNPNVLEGTLAYISPEQTGRMSRPLDYRTDFYSLGATFYELLTDQLPFDTNDAMELVHFHIAKQPIPPHQVNPQIPKAVSNIVMKLLAKTAESRYQSAWGVKADLEECLTQVLRTGKISEFPLSCQDISDKFQIPQKLYGREQQIETLLAAFERVIQGTTEMMLVSGYSGIGKSALVQVLYKPITQKRGYFISGKFDQLQGNIPYSAVVSAFSDLMRQLLTETSAQLNQWRERLLAAFGANGQVIIDVIPQVELIVGKQPSVPELPPTEAQNRLKLVFQNLIRVLAPEHPLVIFLDDLQWADAASLQLMQLLITASDSQYLFLIVAYRDNEVNGVHPLILTLEQIRKAGAIVNHISLAPLHLPSVGQLISETLKCSPHKGNTLAELVLNKTNGNPFFINEFLKSLHTEKLLEFDFNQGSWQWDLEQIQARGITDNVVELMAGKIQKLSAATQQVLQLAACIGNQFDLHTLAMSCEKSQKETVALLARAIAEGMVLPLSDAYKSIELDVPQPPDGLKVEYKFAHDRIQQATYSLIPAEKKQALHRQVGLLLLQNTVPEKRSGQIFDIVNQLNLGIELINHQSQRDELAQLNLIAGKKAKASAAYKPAFNYFMVGVGLLSENSWLRQYELTLNLYVEAAEAAYLSTYFDEMERLAEVVLRQAKTLLDKVKVYEVIIQAYKAQNQMLEAAKTGLAVLKLLGVRLPEKPNKLNILLGLVRTKLALAGKKPSDLIDLPEMTDPYKLATIRILVRINLAAYSAVPELYPLILFKQVNLSVKHGNANESASAYAGHALILCGVVGDINSGYQFGQLALRLLDRFNAKHMKAEIIETVSFHVSHWKEHVRETLEPLRSGYHSGLETGHREAAAICAVIHSCYSFFIAKELAALEREMATYSESIAQLGQEPQLNYNEMMRQVVLNLMGQSEIACRLSGESYDEQTMLPLHQQANDRTGIYILYLSKLLLCYLFAEYSQAVENAAIAENYLDAATATPIVPLFYFYDSLARLSVFPDAQKSEQKRILRKVTANQKKMKKWAHYAPMNYLHKFYIVEAERHRILGQYAKAMDLYDQGIELAKENEYINEEALANELAAKVYLERGKITIAQTYMLNARYCYLRWGATRKVRDLDTRYHQLIFKMSGGTRTEIIDTKDSTSSSGEELDLKTVVKASQAISSEIMLDKLLAKLLKIVMENAGAQKGYFIMSKKQELFIEAAGIVEPAQEIVRQSIPVTTSQDLPITLINYIERTKETVVLSEATADGRFSHDPYITTQKPKSVLCTPILNQGKLISIIYLENNLTIGAFNSQRLEILRLLCSQAVASLENAQLYEQLENYSRTLEQKVTERTLELLAKNEQMQQEISDRQRAETALQTANQQLQRLASLDDLTQIANRRRFDEYLSQEWHRGVRETTPLCLILCDIDYFKRYNDTYGHQAGDACLQQVAQAISRVVKRPADLVARYGGEEFAVILPNTNASGAVHAADAIHKQIQQLKISHAQSSVSEYVTLSVGVSSTVPTQEFSPEALIAVADEALYEAKEQGRNRVIEKTLAALRRGKGVNLYGQ